LKNNYASMAELVDAVDLKVNLSLCEETCRVDAANSGKPQHVEVVAIPS
jgi:hypothetical protein